MKIWMLYDNPYDEGCNVYGLFSTKAKAKRAIKLFQGKANHELFGREFEVDSLEQFFEKALSEYRFYTGWYMGGKWDFSPQDLDSFLDKGGNNSPRHVMLKTSQISVTIYAKSNEDAERIATELMVELNAQPEDERGWKWLEKELSDEN